ncbi:hypothetical protein BJ912DRAFT_87700 [Pholiota molesta]|nr:hypothetical protein BJ912DRAFT_87700 [Pholiota molesta]
MRRHHFGALLVGLHATDRARGWYPVSARGPATLPFQPWLTPLTVTLIRPIHPCDTGVTRRSLPLTYIGHGVTPECCVYPDPCEGACPAHVPCRQCSVRSLIRLVDSVALLGGSGLYTSCCCTPGRLKLGMDSRYRKCSS